MQFNILFYSHLKNFTAMAEHTITQPSITSKSCQIPPKPAPCMTIILRAVFMRKVGKASHRGRRNVGIASSGQKQQPRNIRGKSTAMDRACALWVFLTKIVKTNPKVTKARAAIVSTNQYKK
jgi:hypothetical protein